MTPAVRPLAVLGVFSARSASLGASGSSESTRQAGRFLLKIGLQRRSFRSSVVSWSSSSNNSNNNKKTLSYRVAASCSAKGRRLNLEKNTHVFDPATQDAIGVVLKNGSRGKSQQQQQQQKRPASGEDAFFASATTDTGAIAFGVADGVGGWAEHRVDPAEVSHGLCTYMAEHALAAEQPLKPKELLQMGYDAVQADKSIRAGGTTASVGVAQPDGSVELANLGDSGSVLLRLAAVHQYSTPQTHAFNTPYQLNVIPPRLRQQAYMFGGTYFEDLPRDAAVSTASLQHGDVLVLATDGVFDNLNNQEILKIVTSRMLLTGAWAETAGEGIWASSKLDALTQSGGLGLSSSSSSSASSSSSSASSSAFSSASISKSAGYNSLQGLLAASIVGEAKLASVDVRRDGPFAKEAQRYHPGHWYRGGKVDDICVVVVVAVENT
ncbi:Protein phosphatase 2C homolog 7, mitochondrial [Talaromyces islandicus]|uniref:Protein phosphatase n=1 Tax=Talaromyces islandicus TaxID=28573 RepID=A0A0U1M8Z5_TALIS|nr:Protein phosphatase 2C homolog 7, mitochondrial [Talaromyces islandicus]